MQYDLQSHQQNRIPRVLLCLINIGSSEQRALQILQIPRTAETGIIPKWLFPPRFSDKNKFTFSRPETALVAPNSARTNKQQTASNGRGMGSLEW